MVRCPEPHKKFRAMIIGWQNATYAINSLVNEFNKWPTI